MRIVVTKDCKEWERGTFTIVFDTEEERKALLESVGTNLNDGKCICPRCGWSFIKGDKS